jgi:hypothetical protein
MSDPVAKAERAKAKTIRQGGIDQKENLRSRSKKEKPFVVLYKWVKPVLPGWNDVWRTMGKYRTRQEAEKAMRDCERKYPGWYIMDLSSNAGIQPTERSEDRLE